MTPPASADPRPVEVARADTGRGEVALRRRGQVLELIVDGVFAMDTVDVASERALAALALDRLRVGDGRGLEVVVGGLGLGYTGQRVLEDPRVQSLLLVELHGALVDWARRGLLPDAARVLADPRVRVLVADVLDAVPALAHASADAVLLDVDNGPGFLVHRHNARAYATPFLTAALRVVRPGGVLGIWSAQPEPALAEDLGRLCAQCEEMSIPLTRDGRHLEYAVYLARKALLSEAGSGKDPSKGPSEDLSIS